MDSEKQSPQLLETLLESLLFPKVFRTFRMAIQPSKLMIALLALAVICLTGWIMDFNKTVVLDVQGNVTELDVYMDPARGPEAISEFCKVEESGGRRGVFSTLWHFNRERFNDALYSLFALNISEVARNIAKCFQAAAWAMKHHLKYCIIFGLIELAVISVAGGAICRIAALQFAGGEKPGVFEALRFSIRRFLSFFATPLVPVGMIIFIGVFVFLLGLIGNIGWVGELFVGIFMPLALLAGGLIAVFLIGAVAGFNLMFPAIAYEGSDCFDAISRSFNYIYSRPWRMGFYTAVAAVYGAICYVFVRFFAFLLLLVTYGLLDMGVFRKVEGVDKLTRIWSKPTFLSLLGRRAEASLRWSEDFAAALIFLFSLAVIGLLISFIMSFYFSANTIIYALLRKRVDNTALEEIYQVSEEVEPTVPAAPETEAEPEPKPEPETQPGPESEQPPPQSETEDT